MLSVDDRRTKQRKRLKLMRFLSEQKTWNNPPSRHPDTRNCLDHSWENDKSLVWCARMHSRADLFKYNRKHPHLQLCKSASSDMQPVEFSSFSLLLKCILLHAICRNNINLNQTALFIICNVWCPFNWNWKNNLRYT